MVLGVQVYLEEREDSVTPSAMTLSDSYSSVCHFRRLFVPSVYKIVCHFRYFEAKKWRTFGMRVNNVLSHLLDISRVL